MARGPPGRAKRPWRPPYRSPECGKVNGSGRGGWASDTATNPREKGGRRRGLWRSVPCPPRTSVPHGAVSSRATPGSAESVVRVGRFGGCGDRPEEPPPPPVLGDPTPGKTTPGGGTPPLKAATASPAATYGDTRVVSTPVLLNR